MGLFKKKPKPAGPQPVEQYSEIEQGTIEEPPARDPLAELAEQVAKVLQNQATIRENQQIILNEVTKAQQMIQFYAAGEPEEPEPTEEEIKAAIAEARAKKTKGGK